DSVLKKGRIFSISSPDRCDSKASTSHPGEREAATFSPPPRKCIISCNTCDNEFTFFHVCPSHGHFSFERVIRDGPLAYIWKEILQNEGEKASYAQTALAVFDFPLRVQCRNGTALNGFRVRSPSGA